jgi:ABC-2 type transport system ATP-binding protein
VNKSSGTVSVFGHDLERELEAAKACIGIVPQELNFNQFETPQTILVNQAGFYGIPRPLARERTEQYLSLLQLADKRNKMARGLSGGMKRRLMIARALVHQPRLLILDEPTAGVDIEIRRGMWKTLKEVNAAGTTVILTTHYLEEAESLCRNLAIIDRGRIIEQGPMKALLAKLDVEGFLFDIDGRLPATLPAIAGITLLAEDDHTLDVEMPREMDLNRVFAALGEAGIRVRSMRTKSNRLEELFVRLTGQPEVVPAKEASA